MDKKQTLFRKSPVHGFSCPGARGVFPVRDLPVPFAFAGRLLTTEPQGRPPTLPFLKTHKDIENRREENRVRISEAGNQMD